MVISDRSCPSGGVIAAENRISPTAVGWLTEANVVPRGGGLDELPACYKRLPHVLAAHGRTIHILYTPPPMGVAMAGANVFDPYKT